MSGDGGRDSGDRIIPPPDAAVRARAAAPVRARAARIAKTPAFEPVKRETAAIVHRAAADRGGRRRHAAAGPPARRGRARGPAGRQPGPAARGHAAPGAAGHPLRSEPHRGVFVVDLHPGRRHPTSTAPGSPVESAACRIDGAPSTPHRTDRGSPPRAPRDGRPPPRGSATTAALGGRGHGAAPGPHRRVRQPPARPDGRHAVRRDPDVPVRADRDPYHEPVDLVAEHTAIIAALRAGDEDRLIRPARRPHARRPRPAAAPRARPRRHDPPAGVRAAQRPEPDAEPEPEPEPV